MVTSAREPCRGRRRIILRPDHSFLGMVLWRSLVRQTVERLGGGRFDPHRRRVPIDCYFPTLVTNLLQGYGYHVGVSRRLQMQAVIKGEQCWAVTVVHLAREPCRYLRNI